MSRGSLVRAETTAAERKAGWTWDHALSGVVPPLISPLDASGEPDEGALGRLVAYVLGGGCSGLFALGAAGKGRG